MRRPPSPPRLNSPPAAVAVVRRPPPPASKHLKHLRPRLEDLGGGGRYFQIERGPTDGPRSNDEVGARKGQGDESKSED